jgi:hypothetical protein
MPVLPSVDSQFPGLGEERVPESQPPRKGCIQRETGVRRWLTAFALRFGLIQLICRVFVFTEKLPVSCQPG